MSAHTDELSTVKWIDKIRSAMAIIDAVDIDECHRKTIWRCLSSELVEAIDRYDEQCNTRNSGKKWSKEDDKIIYDFLSGKTVTTWGEEAITVQELSLKLGRNAKQTKKRAIELGFSAGVDYYRNS